MTIAENHVFSESGNACHILHCFLIGDIHPFSSAAGLHLKTFFIDQKNVSFHHFGFPVIHIQIFFHRTASIQIVNLEFILIVRLITFENKADLSFFMKAGQDLILEIHTSGISVPRQTLKPLFLRITARCSSTKYTEGATTPS